jgi:hypothetical protein
MALARSILNEVIDGNRVPRKALADEIEIAWVKRYGSEVLGLTVTELSVVDAAVAVMEAFTALQARMRTLETVNPRMAKAELQTQAERKAG